MEISVQDLMLAIESLKDADPTAEYVWVHVEDRSNKLAEEGNVFASHSEQTQAVIKRDFIKLCFRRDRRDRRHTDWIFVIA